MALVQHNQLPVYARLHNEGITVLAPESVHTSAPRLNIGFLNMMPDAALNATERQFFRLLGTNKGINCYIHPFYLDVQERSAESQHYLQTHYHSSAEIADYNLDALLVTGANITQAKLSHELFWADLEYVLNWSRANLKSTLCSCLATHAAMQVYYDVERRHMGKKCWGVFEHHLAMPEHPLIKDVEAKIFMAHSRYNDVSVEDFERNNIQAIICSAQAGVQLAAEKDASVIYFQGHPEYDDISLLKEYKREVKRYLSAEREDFPPVPENYFNSSAMSHAERYREKIQTSPRLLELLQEFPETELQQGIANNWWVTARQIFSNWLDSLIEMPK